MTRQTAARLADIEAAIAAIDQHVAGGDLSEGLVFDAVRIRLVEIGEAVKGLPPELLVTEPDIPWSQIVRMRDVLAHRYFDTTHSVVAGTVQHDLPELAAAVTRLRDHLSG